MPGTQTKAARSRAPWNHAFPSLLGLAVFAAQLAPFEWGYSPWWHLLAVAGYATVMGMALRAAARARTAFTIAQGIVVLPVAGVLALLSCGPIQRELAELPHATALLRSAQSPDDRASSAGSLGLSLDFPDGWLAIRYQDSHAFPGWSLAVAIDSHGRRYISHRHFCGQFAAYRDRLDDLEESVHSEQDRSYVQAYLAAIPAPHSLATSRSLAEATQRLLELGFHRQD